MISAFLSRYKTVGIGALIVLLLSAWAYGAYLNFRLESTKAKLEQSKKEFKELESAALLAIEEMNKSLEMERSLAKEREASASLKAEVLKQSGAVKQEVLKRGELIDDEKNSNFVIVDF